MNGFFSFLFFFLSLNILLFGKVFAVFVIEIYILFMSFDHSFVFYPVLCFYILIFLGSHFIILVSYNVETLCFGCLENGL